MKAKALVLLASFLVGVLATGCKSEPSDPDLATRVLYDKLTQIVASNSPPEWSEYGVKVDNVGIAKLMLRLRNRWEVKDLGGAGRYRIRVKDYYADGTSVLVWQYEVSTKDKGDIWRSQTDFWK